MLRIVIRSPLIKINEKTVEILLNHYNGENTSDSIKDYVLKVLIFRWKLVDGISKEDMLSKLGELFESTKAGPFETKVMIKNAINDIFE